MYYLISADLTHTLRADVESHIPNEDPFSYHGGPGRTSFETGELHASFVGAHIIEIAPPPVTGARKASTGSLLEVPKPLTLRLTKFGVLSRKGTLAHRSLKRFHRPRSLTLHRSVNLSVQRTSAMVARRLQTGNGRIGLSA